MQISAKNQIKGKVTSVIHGTSYTQVAVEQTDADGNTTGSFIHAAIPVDICKKMELTGGNIVTCIFPAANMSSSQLSHVVYVDPPSAQFWVSSLCGDPALRLARNRIFEHRCQTGR